MHVFYVCFTLGLIFVVDWYLYGLTMFVIPCVSQCGQALELPDELELLHLVLHLLHLYLATIFICKQQLY